MQNELSVGNESTGTVKLIYIFYLVGIVVGFTSVIGLIIAYIYRSDAAEWLKPHYRYQIRTFWIGLLYGIVTTVLMFALVGYFLYFLLVIWLVVRCVKGLKALGEKVPPAKPATWLF